MMDVKVFYRAALEKKESEERKKYQPIDYDVPITKSEGNSLGLGAKVSHATTVPYVVFLLRWKKFPFLMFFKRN